MGKLGNIMVTNMRDGNKRGRGGGGFFGVFRVSELDLLVFGDIGEGLRGYGYFI